MIKKRIATEEEKAAFNERIFDVCVSFNALCEEIGLIYGIGIEHIKSVFADFMSQENIDISDCWDILHSYYKLFNTPVSGDFPF